MSATFLTLPYVAEFECLGGDCEDSCCKNWDIKFDKAHYHLLKARMQDDKEEEKLFHRVMVVNDEGNDKNYAHIRMEDNGLCPLLDADGLCHIHRNYGQEPLCDTCAFYPRVISNCYQTMEMTGALSCPEMARMCLLGDYENEFIEFDHNKLPHSGGFPIMREINESNQDDYASQFTNVRNTMLSIAKCEDYSIKSRLYFLAYLANKISSMYHQNCMLEDSELLDDELSSVVTESVLNSLQDYLSQYAVDEPIALVIVQSIIQLKVNQSPEEKFSQVAREVLDSYKDESSSKKNNAKKNNSSVDDTLLADELSAVFYRRQAHIKKHFHVKLECILSRYLINCLYREWFITMPNPFTYVHMLTIRIAILRFLLFSHPRILEMAEKLDENSGSKEEITKSLEELVITIFYNFARAVDHNLPFLQVVYDAICEQQMMNFDYSIPFIKV